MRAVRLLAAAVLLNGAVAGGAETGDRFAPAGVSEASVRQAFDALQSGVRVGDPGPVADMVSYPLRINRANGTHDVIADRAQFVARFSGLFSGRMRQVILAQRFDDLVASVYGIMLGSGDLWLAGVCQTPGCASPRIAIVAINAP